MSSKVESRLPWFGMVDGIQISLDKMPKIGDIIETIHGKLVVTKICVTRRMVLFAQDGDGVAP